MSDKMSYSKERVLESIDYKIAGKRITTFILGSILSVLTAIAFLLGTRQPLILLIALPFPVLYSPALISALLKRRSLLKDADAFVFFTVTPEEWEKVRFRGYRTSVTIKDKDKGSITLTTSPIAVGVHLALLSKLPLTAFENRKLMVGYNKNTGKVIAAKIVR